MPDNYENLQDDQISSGPGVVDGHFPKGRQALREAEWENFKETILGQYKNKSLRDVQDFMEENHGFKPRYAFSLHFIISLTSCLGTQHCLGS